MIRNQYPKKVKTRGALFIALLTLVFSIQAQTKKDIFNPSTTITWLGLDFSGTKLVGDRERWKNADYMLEVMESLNNLMINERDKYDIALAFDKMKVDYELRVTMLHNSHLDMSGKLSSSLDDHFLKPSDIQAICKGYDYKGLSGIGLMFNVETFNKPAEQAIVWVTFINMESKEVLFSEKMMQPPMGFGLRNYWAGAIAKMLKDIRRVDYEYWRKKYSHKDS